MTSEERAALVEDLMRSSSRPTLRPGQSDDEAPSPRRADRTAEVLKYVGSHELAGAIVSLWEEGLLEPDELRAILLGQWDHCEAHGPYRAKFVAMFREAREVGDITDTGRRLAGELTIYRGNAGEREPVGISWTLSRAKAQWFAHYLQSPRGAFLGIRRPDAGADLVWRAKVDAADVLGYFGRRREQEVVVDPATLREVEPIPLRSR